MTLINRGAEARIFKDVFDDRVVLVKERFVKNYRHPHLDKSLNSSRLRAEIRCLMKCKQLGIRTPAIYSVDSINNKLYMEFIPNSITVKQFITERNTKDKDIELKDLSTIAQSIGRIIASMHNEDIVHGDLTTSNFLINTSDHKISVIDFGLGSTVSSLEDKAVDLYVLERAILSSHPNSEMFIKEIMKAYSENINKSIIGVLKKLEEVQQRGRKRTMVG